MEGATSETNVVQVEEVKDDVAHALALLEPGVGGAIVLFLVSVVVVVVVAAQIPVGDGLEVAKLHDLAVLVDRDHLAVEDDVAHAVDKAVAVDEACQASIRARTAAIQLGVVVVVARAVKVPFSVLQHDGN